MTWSREESNWRSQDFTEKAVLWYTFYRGNVTFKSFTIPRACLDVCFVEEKEMTMANWLEDLTKTMANDKLSRRQAIGSIAGVVAGATIITWLPDQVLAKHVPWKKQCPNGGCNCTCGFENCFGNPNTNCYCFQSIEGT